MCYGHLKDTETSDWNTAWEHDVEHPSNWKAMPAKWYHSCCSHLCTQRDKAAKEKQTKPNYDEATLSLVRSKLEGALYDPCKPYDNSRFLLLHKTSKLVTLHLAVTIVERCPLRSIQPWSHVMANCHTNYLIHILEAVFGFDIALSSQWLPRHTCLMARVFARAFS